MITIQTKTAYDEALDCIDKLFGAPQGTPDGEVLNELIPMVVEYEDKYYPIG